MNNVFFLIIPRFSYIGYTRHYQLYLPANFTIPTMRYDIIFLDFFLSLNVFLKGAVHYYKC